MYKKIFSFLAVLLLFLPGNGQAQEFAPVGTAVAQFLEIGVGARSAGMGEAYTAQSDGAASVFWNPGGIATTKKRGFFLAYNSWPADISIGGIALSWNFGNYGTIALSSVFLNTGDMTVTTVNDPEGLSGTKFSLVNYAVGVSYARFLTDRLSLGVTAKIVREDYMGYGYSTLAFDVGTLYRTNFHGLTLGMSILHFGQEITFSGSYYDYSDPESAQGDQKNFDNYSLPINFRVGVSMDIWKKDKNKIISAMDMVHPNNNLEQYNLGFEYSFDNMLFIRSGYKFRIDQGGFSLGAGVNYQLGDALSTELDYSFSELGILPSVHRLSASFLF